VKESHQDKPAREQTDPKPRIPKEKASAEDVKKEMVVRTAKILNITRNWWFGLGKKK
jgi:hypothetical protein